MKQIDNVNDLVEKLTGVGNVALYLLVSLAVIYIVWNIVQYFIKGGADDTVRKTAGMGILWGIVGLFLIVSLWGIVNVLLGTFKTNTSAPVDKFPQVNFTNNADSSSYVPDF
jgi:hypothetical protein